MKSFDVHRAEIIYGRDGFYAWIISQGQNLMESGTTHSLLAHRINKKVKQFLQLDRSKK